MAQAATLQARRRELIAAYARARRRHEPSAALSRRLANLTLAALRAEIRDAKARRPAAPDLFSRLEAA